MHARSALFDLYGDHLLARGGSAPVAALIKLLEPLGINAPAVRTAVSRMVTQGWLDAVDLSAGPGYAVTDRARSRLQEAGRRIYRTDGSGAADPGWDGAWHIRVLAPIQERGRRERIRNQLRFLGLAPISDSTWVTPRRSAEADRLLAEEGLEVVSLTTHDADPAARLLQAFDVDGLAAAYAGWLHDSTAYLATSPAAPDDRTSFAMRSELLHSWRKFLFADPGLPAVLLPADWPGHAAAAFFDEHAARLLPAAVRYLERCLDRQGAPV